MLPTRLLFCALPILAAAQSSTAEKEVAAGRGLAAEVERRGVVIADSAVTTYVDQLVQRLASSAKLRTALTVKVIAGPNLFAATMPGGFIDVNASLLLAAESEAELAGVLAHQVAHLELPLLSGIPNAAAGSQIPMFFLMGRNSGLCVRGPESPLSVAVPVSPLSNIRETEAKADQLAIAYLLHAGYDPVALVDFYERAASHSGRGALTKAFDAGTVPLPSTRSQAESARGVRDLVETTGRFVEIEGRVTRLTAAPSPPGLSRPSESPSLLKKNR